MKTIVAAAIAPATSSPARVTTYRETGLVIIAPCATGAGTARAGGASTGEPEPEGLCCAAGVAPADPDGAVVGRGFPTVTVRAGGVRTGVGVFRGAEEGAGVDGGVGFAQHRQQWWSSGRVRSETSPHIPAAVP